MATRYEWFQSQFHYGSIKTYLAKCKVMESKESQFHYGSIKTLELITRANTAQKVSIPLWFD